MAGRGPKREAQGGITLLDLPLIESHCSSCPTCGKKLVELARKHGISTDTIFSAK